MPYYTEALRRRKQELDENAWHTNIYTLRAISTIGKGRYPQEPLDIYGVRKVIGDVNEEAEKVTDADMFGAWAMAFNMQKYGTIDGSEVREDG